jgi:hypothetical protein
MESAGNSDGRALVWSSGRRRPRLECRECEVVCERVVSPWHCLRSKCACVYAYADGETTYFGCLHKVFSPELDLAAFSDDQGRPGRGPDPYGPIRVVRAPRPHCRVTIEQAYDALFTCGGCCNPTFFHDPLAPSDERMRFVTRARKDQDPGPQG